MIMRFGRGSGNASRRYFLNGKELQVVQSYKDLGVVVDVGLKFHEHVRGVVCRASGLMGDLLRSTVCRERTFMLTLYVSHIRPIIDYGSSVWNVG